MKFLRALSFLTLVVLSLTLLGVSAQPQENRRGVPRLVKYVGQVPALRPPTAVEGSVHAKSAVSVTFAIYAEQDGGAALWQETQNVALDADSRYSVLLGAASRDGVPAELFATGEPRWLGVRVSAPGDAEASGEQARVLLVSVPYALRAADSETLGGRAAADFVLREELAGWSGVAPGASDAPRAVGGTQGIAVDATGIVGRVPRVTAATGSLITYGDGLFFDDGNGVGLGTTSPVALLDLQLTTAIPRDTLSAAVTLNNSVAIPATVVTPFRMTLNDQSTATNLSKQAMRVIYDRNVGATGGVSVFDSAITLATFIRTSAPYTYRALNVEGPRIFNGQSLDTLFGIFIEAPPANVGGQPAGTITNKFALVTAPGSGNVGIGTTAPAHLLEVSGGNFKLTGLGNSIIFPDGTVMSSAGAGPFGGTITGVTAGAGLTGGGTAGGVSLALDAGFTDARYLQLTGGTLTGALNGPGATFTGAISALTGTFSSRLIARGTLEAATLGTATSGTGFNSASQVFFYSVHNGASAVPQDFRWIAEPLGNGMPNPTGRMKLQWNNGGGAADTGLTIGNDGVLTFAPGQTFPGGGGITQVDSGDGLTGGPITSTGTLAVDSTVARRNAINSFTGDQTITGNFTLSGSINNGFRVLAAAGTPNVVGGSSVNVVTMGAAGATIGGGGNAGQPNSVAANYGTVGGGHANAANGLASTVSGGEANNALGTGAAIGGGLSNVTNGVITTISGGAGNQVNSNGGTVSGGSGNTVFAGALNATIGGGVGNIASAGGNDGTVGGGNSNGVSAQAATVSGGSGNNASNANATVGGGNSNTANGFNATISGGSGNNAGGGNATVGGGQSNNASGSTATVGGGNLNTASNNFGTVSGGNANSAGGILATIGGGTNNTVNGIGSAVGGGSSNFAGGDHSFVGGGLGNSVGFGMSSVVGGGHLNSASGDFAAIPGGDQNDASGQFSFAAGRRAKASDDGSFVWGDSTDADVFSVGLNSFTVRATGGVRFHTGAQPFAFLNNALMFPDGTSQTTAFTGGGGGAGGRLTIAAITFTQDPAQGGIGGNPADTGQRSANNGLFLNPPSRAFANAALPQGATVNGFRACGRDSDGDPGINFTATLKRKLLITTGGNAFLVFAETIAVAGSTDGDGTSGDQRCFSASSFSNATIDNNTYFYFVVLEAGGTTIEHAAVVIEYQ